MKILILFICLLCMACAKKLPYKELLKDDDTLSNKQFLMGAEPLSAHALENAVGQKNTPSQLSQHEWLYVPSTLKATRGNAAFLPYMLGYEKVVRFQFTRDKLQVLEVEKDPRFAANRTNQKPVLSLPIEHIEYQCVRNAYNECTSQEEESHDLSWNTKTYFKMKADQLALQEINFLPETWGNLFAPCLQQTGARLVDYSLSEGVLNFQVEKYFKASLVCHFNMVREVTDLLNLSFTARLHYAFTRMDKLVTPDYTPVNKKPLPFGVFETRRHQLALDHRDLLEGQKRLLNRWQPGRQINMFLSPEFEKPEHQALKAASLEAVQSINKALAQAQTETRLSLKPAPADMQVGDLRYPTLVLEEEAPAYNVVGYGPSVTNPHTGEIVYARVVMYLGVLKKMVHHAYDELVHRQKAEAVPHTTPSIRPRFHSVFYAQQGLDFADPFVDKFVDRVDEGRTASTLSNLRPTVLQHVAQLSASWQQVKEAVSTGTLTSHTASTHLVTDESLASTPSLAAVLRGSKITQAVQAVHNPRLHSLSFESEVAQLVADKNFEAARRVFMRQHNMYPGRAVPSMARQALSFQGRQLLTALASKTDPKNLKPWRDLTDAQRHEVMKKVLPFLWEPILLHELGHILGLRHNFAASEDKANFYTAKEYAAAQSAIQPSTPTHPITESGDDASSDPPVASGGSSSAGASSRGSSSRSSSSGSSSRSTPPRAANKDNTQTAPADPVPAFSSVMDYSGNEIDTLRRMGKYDIATLRYLYANQIEVEGGRFVDVDKLKPRQRIKGYVFCTDEHVALNPNCNPFDSGTNLKSIVTHAVHDYEDSYTKINYRNGRRRFSRLDEPAYLGRRDFIFRRLRLVLERFEYIQNNFQVSPREWRTYPELVDLQQALVEAVKFYIGVIIRPDVMCAISAHGSAQVVDVVPLRDISATSMHCFDNLNPSSFYQPVAQGGAFFQPQSLGSADGNMAEIDIQGVWIDKLLAWRYLFGRKLNILPLDHFSDSFMQHPDFKPVLNRLIEDVLLDQVEAPVKMKFIYGPTKVLSLRHQMFHFDPVTQTASPGAHVVPEALHPVMKWFFDLPDGSSFFQPLLLKMLHTYAPAPLHYWSGRELVHNLSVWTRLPDGHTAKDYVRVDVGDRPYYILPSSPLALKMAFRLLMVRHLQTYKPQELKKILDRHKSLPEPTDEPDAPAPDKPVAAPAQAPAQDQGREPDQTAEVEVVDNTTAAVEAADESIEKTLETDGAQEEAEVKTAAATVAAAAGEEAAVEAGAQEGLSETLAKKDKAGKNKEGEPTPPTPEIDPLFTEPIDSMGLKIITPQEVEEFLLQAYHGPTYYEYMLEQMALYTQ